MATDRLTPLLLTARQTTFRANAGFTLLELTVTLVLLALAAALVAPVFRQDNQPNDNLRAVVAGARELAVRRAETLVLQVDQGGAWRLRPVGDTTSISSGVITRDGLPLRIRVTPLGACFNDGQSGAVDWDAFACAPNNGGSPAR